MIFLSTLINKLLSAILSIFIVRLITVEDYGKINVILSLILILQTFSGLGLNWSLLRFGSIENSYNAKVFLFKSFNYWGLIFNIVLILIVNILFLFFSDKIGVSLVWFFILSLSLSTNYILELFRSLFRILNLNSVFSFLNNISSVVNFLLSFSLTILYGPVGFLLAQVLFPILTIFVFSIKSSNFFSLMKVKQRLLRQHVSYGISTGLGSVANQLLLLIGPIIIPILGNDDLTKEVAYFKVATIIPFNLVILPSILMTTDFVFLSKNFLNKIELIKYYKSYCKSVFLISIIPFFLLLFFNKKILLTLFGKQYEGSVEMSFILILATFFSFLFRIPLGNLLAAVGKSTWNVTNAFISLGLFLVLSYFLFPFWGTYSVALAISFSLMFSGFISLFLFILYLRRL